ncbi:MmcQ/YjbR family DNA-binding protein [Aquisalinus flavus]|uniref:MmcQ/YjbR family DNA-binding protein n=1 Tax=Aquisalinus flavus TaxID=1526572 RepID=A0A8J2Y6F7_9PROT|nr:MmcQ/YjbR family DNA-binding protein [Aquisalinus flavus]MBD0427607.1 MmcQ/YjbR family DNA-binding protein [Aquisalinus flavus]UNE47395.1 MmcQ/YjbR family DNA-binding protein [Aquisalinus flavus]GGD02343.1 hypothetical protein GCM10011342_09210 [Aquisalinus flavus]
MTPAEFNDFCLSLPATSHVVQWGGADVYKVGGKVFAVAGWGTGEHFAVTFKVTPLGFEILKDQPGCRPAPYLASRGMTWIQHYQPPGLTAGALRDYVQQSHRLVADGLTKKIKRELGLIRPEEGKS